MKSMISHGNTFLKPFCLIIYTPGPNRIYISPVFLRLRMDERVPVNLGGRSNQDTRVFCFCKSQAMVSSKGSDFKCLNRNFQIIDRACRRSKMENVIECTRHVHEFTYILMVEFKLLQFEKVLDVFQIS